MIVRHYVNAYQTSKERNHWLPRYLRIHNSHRYHLALGGLTLSSPYSG
jgi:hypothetical protein